MDEEKLKEFKLDFDMLKLKLKHNPYDPNQTDE